MKSIFFVSGCSFQKCFVLRGKLVNHKNYVSVFVFMLFYGDV